MEAKRGDLKRKIPVHNFDTDHELQEYLHLEMWLKLNAGPLLEAALLGHCKISLTFILRRVSVIHRVPMS